MNQNQNNFTCPHCIALQRDFELLQSKEEKLRRKLKSLENLVHDLQLKNNLLEEENKTLRASIMPSRPQNSADDENPKKVFSVLNDFDGLLSSQGLQIGHLIEDREKLVILSFNALTLLSKQESIINKFEMATKKLLQFISERGESSVPAIREYSFLGFDISKEIETLQRSFYISKVMKTDDGEVIDDKDILDIVNDLSRNPSNQKTIQKVLNYITHQTQEKDILRSQLKKEERLKEKEIKNLLRIFKHLHISSNNSKNNTADINNQESCNYDISIVLLEIKKLRKLAHDSYDYLFIIHEIVNILTKSAQRNCHNDENVVYCIKRLKRWLEVPKTRINLCQEINYLINTLSGTYFPYDQVQFDLNDNYEYQKNDLNANDVFNVGEDIDLSSVSVDSVLNKIEIEKKSQQQSQEIYQQLDELRETVEELRNELLQIDSERKDFIQNNLSGTVSKSTSWKKICLHLLNKLKNREEAKQNEA